MPGTVLLLAAAPAGKSCLVDAASVLPVLAAVPPTVLSGTDTANVVELADPLEPQAVLTRLRAAAASPAPLTVFVTGQLHLDRRQHLPHLALARTTPSTVRYTGFPWHWFREELRLRAPGSTSLVLDLHADAETWEWLGAHPLDSGRNSAVYGRIAPPPSRRTVAGPAYMKAVATLLRSGHRPPLDQLHQQALTRVSPDGGAATDILLTAYAPPRIPPRLRPSPQAPVQAQAPAPLLVPTSVRGYDPNPAQAPAPVSVPLPGEIPAYGSPPAPGSAPLPAQDTVPSVAAPLPAQGRATASPPLPPQNPAPGPAQSAQPLPAQAPAQDSPPVAPQPSPSSPTPVPVPLPAPLPPRDISSGPAPVHAPGSAQGPERSAPAPSAPPSSEQSPAQGSPPVAALLSPSASAPSAAPVAVPPSTEFEATLVLPLPVRSPAASVPPPPAHSPAPSDPHATIAAAVESGRHGEAEVLAAHYEQGALRAHGPASEEALHWIEVRADLAMMAGDPVRSCRAWLMVASARLSAGQAANAPAVEAAVDRAHHQWGQIKDTAAARELGPALAELRGRVPGRRRGALENVLRQLQQLQTQT
ncbi:hypothetical protein [Streptomyces sp. NPDC057623]|uniref:hypothetical protein n=1 Tax=Streptomyces sp. NPDC057623 TaxID=3346187 RepID=UPI0036ADF86F